MRGFLYLSPMFIVASLSLVYMVWQQYPWLVLFESAMVLYVGLGCLLLSGLIAVLRPGAFPLSYDVFLVGTLCTWFVHWREVYRIDAPVFLWYPVYFVFIAMLLNRQVVERWALMDDLQLRMMRLIHSSRLFHPFLLNLLVVLSVYFSEYFLFYPMAVSLVLIRCAFGMVLQKMD
jgi:hypothetical protein